MTIITNNINEKKEYLHNLALLYKYYQTSLNDKNRVINNGIINIMPIEYIHDNVDRTKTQNTPKFWSDVAKRGGHIDIREALKDTKCRQYNLC